MSSLYERLVNENRQMIRKGKRQGREEAKLEIAKKLIKKNTNEEMILEITEVTPKDLEKLKKQVLEQKWKEFYIIFNEKRTPWTHFT